MSTGFFKKGKGKHGGINPSIAAKDIYLVNTIKATNEIANKGEDGVNKYISAKDVVQQGVDQIVSGSGITWIEGWKYSNSSYTFIIRGVSYTNPVTEYTLDPSHSSLDRYDIAVLTYDVNGDGIVKIKKGDLQIEGFAAIVPTATPGTEIYLATFPVKAGLSAPDDITNVVIYSEDAAVVDANGLTVIGNSNVSPYSGAICIKVTDFTSIQNFDPNTGIATSIVQKFYIKQATPFNPSLLETFKLQIISDSGKWQNNGTIKLAFIKADNTVVGDYVIIDSRIANAAGNPFAFESRTSVWQTITIPTLAFNTNATDIVGIVVMKDDGRGTDSFRLDLISVQGGIVNNTTSVIKYTDQLINRGENNTSKYTEDKDLAVVAKSGSYNDLEDIPDLDLKFDDSDALTAVTPSNKLITETELATKLDASAYNQHFKGVYLTFAALVAANPTSEAGDYAQVNVVGATDVLNYNWDTEENIWISNAVAGSGANNTDELPEGTVNLYFTVARFLANLTYANVIAALGFIPSTAPNDAQKNSDILKAEIEAKLTGEITSHTHPESGDISQITITTTVSITTATTDGTYGQKGRNVVIDNSTNAINITVDGGVGFVASYVKHGTGAITFVQGSGRTLIQVDATAILNGAVGSTATLSSIGTTDYLRISNV